MGTIGQQSYKHLRDLQAKSQQDLDAYNENQYNLLGSKLGQIESDPNMSQEQKRQAILGIRQQQFKLMTPKLAKKRLADLQQKYGLNDQGPSTVPAEAPLQVGGMTLPGRGEYSVPRPGGADINDILASGTPVNPKDQWITDTQRQLKQLGWDDEHINKFIEAQGGMREPTARASASKFVLTTGKLKNGEPLTLTYDPSTNKFFDLNNQPVDPLAIGWTPNEKLPASAAKPMNKDDRYLAIMAKPPAERTEEENKFVQGYKALIETKTTEPRVAGYRELARSRIVPVINPNNPNEVIPMAAGKAADVGAAMPQSISFQVRKALDRAFTSGPAANTLTYFRTASDHLKQLRSATVALGNGNLRLANQWGQAWSRATGNPAPGNFEAIKQAVAGEIAKTFKGTGATNEEIKLLSDTITRADSPDQLNGVIQQYIGLMDSKLAEMKQQYDMGAQGKPNFGTGGAPMPEPKAGPKVGDIKTYQGHNYRFDGSQWVRQ